MIEIQRVGFNSVETEFSQMPDLLCDYSEHDILIWCYCNFPFKIFHSTIGQNIGITRQIVVVVVIRE